MNIRDDDMVSAVALIVESESPDDPSVTDEIPDDAPPLDAAADGSGQLELDPPAEEPDASDAPDAW